ncbi:unnamed protein product, partial [Allacma fusca]
FSWGIYFGQKLLERFFKGDSFLGGKIFVVRAKPSTMTLASRSQIIDFNYTSRLERF